MRTVLRARLFVMQTNNPTVRQCSLIHVDIHADIHVDMHADIHVDIHVDSGNRSMDKF